ncbi:MAG: HD domain-containing protein [Pseudodesulfovibrio sp.]|uniref:Metal dependent phosphohydrolase n=2 Tax=Pseudodesulfovibrio TaxID=2035811 RepID=E6VTW4_PSEA9|nr:HD domain-containing phosphohydrolase [Pseudodesulfovibrio aespoeensis]ADU61056.1 metal dependent phosphohydrolase [Pseudodesulfovibrio aespoeensis Aspo-2]MBU4245029.1 HD domain-containing protein [Pseudomonadota bacterium]MBV1763545.1 HD domain-containing protein [Pseudodesulfovibrio sp.]MBU4380434.1 HD domain-containing protein [Pseudomonadota bacterium]MBU4476408.1 HD domain-containing protein [Pseudomonadota bacterium]
MGLNTHAARPVSYFPVSPVMLFPEALGDFSVYLWQGGDFVLYTVSGQKFTVRHRKTLHDNGVREVYVQSSEKPQYELYIERNLGTILLDETLPIEVRSQVFYEASTVVMQDIFDHKLPSAVRARHFSRITEIVKNSIRFLASDKTLSAVAPFISHDYKTYTHCMHVFIYSVAVFQAFDMSEADTYECGLGALLHDIGKARIPRRILNKRGSLTQAERDVIKEHPVHGVSMCAHLPMTQNTINCILFHHEKLDGTGYPAGLRRESIPLPVRIISVSDIYDALTTARPYAEAMPPYEALTLIRHQMRDGVDMDIFKRFVAVLSGADMI